jgi:acyl-CoA thioesterase II
MSDPNTAPEGAEKKPAEAGESRALSELIALLDLERLSEDQFRGVSPKDRWQRVYGGQVLGQALVAAGRTVETRLCHSLHAYFLRPGDPRTPIIYDVERNRDGGSISSRRVTAVQKDQTIFILSASFHMAEQGIEHQDPMPEVPDPDSLKSEREWRAEAAALLRAWDGIVFAPRRFHQSMEIRVLLRDAASDEALYYNSPTSSAPESAFASIATNLSNLRLSR